MVNLKGFFNFFFIILFFIIFFFFDNVAAQLCNMQLAVSLKS